MTSSSQFSADDLARHPDWRCLTTAKRYALTGRRKFCLRGPANAKVPPIYITNSGILYYTFAKVQLRTVLPATYHDMLIQLQNHNLMVMRQLTRPPKYSGGDGFSLGDHRISLN